MRRCVGVGPSFLSATGIRHRHWSSGQLIEALTRIRKLLDSRQQNFSCTLTERTYTFAVPGDRYGNLSPRDAGNRREAVHERRCFAWALLGDRQPLAPLALIAEYTRLATPAIGFHEIGFHEMFTCISSDHTANTGEVVQLLVLGRVTCSSSQPMRLVLLWQQ